MTAKQIAFNIRYYRTKVWLFRVTNNKSYLNNAINIFKESNRHLSKYGIQLKRVHRNEQR